MDDPTISKLRGTNAPILFRPPRKYKKAFGFLFFSPGLSNGNIGQKWGNQTDIQITWTNFHFATKEEERYIVVKSKTAYNKNWLQ